MQLSYMNFRDSFRHCINIKDLPLQILDWLQTLCGADMLKESKALVHVLQGKTGSDNIRLQRNNLYTGRYQLPDN